MYNTQIVCTYNTDDVFLTTDEISDDEKAFIRNAIYRQELLNILGMEEYNEEEMVKSIEELYEKIKESTELIECMMKLSRHFFMDESVFGLMILYSYDFMYLTHICVSQYLEYGKIKQTDIDILFQNILLEKL
jgi:hypothetical protein